MKVMCALLMAGKVDVNKGHRTTGCTPLGAAAEEGHVEAVRALMDAGADVNRRSGLMGISSPGMEPMMPLEIAHYMNHSEVVSLLVTAVATRD